MIETTELEEQGQLETGEMKKQFEEMISPKIDPYRNFVARIALMYSIPLLLFAFCLQRGWVGRTSEFWVPLVFTLVVLAPATRLRTGRPFAHKDFQNRDRFLATYALLPASMWCLAVHLVKNPMGAALAFFLVLVAYDWILIRTELLCVYVCNPSVYAGSGAKVLLLFNAPLWGYLGLALLLTHIFGSDKLTFVAGTIIVIALPVAGLWLYWRKRGAPMHRYEAIRNVAVVGAGWSGIYAVRWLNEAGLQVTCFEATDSLGGIWKY